MRTKRLCLERERFTAALPSRGKRLDLRLSVSSVSSIKKVSVRTKARSGRGSKCEEWVIALESDLVHELDRLRKLGMKVSTNTLALMSTELIRANECTKYNRDMREERDEKILSNLITPCWVQIFMHWHDIFVRRQTEKLKTSSEAQVMIEKRVDFFLERYLDSFSVVYSMRTILPISMRHTLW